MTKTKKQTAEWLMALEAERHDQSWKNRKPVEPVEYTKIIYRDRDNKFRDDIFFHAGRFAQGATDQEAVNANRIAKNLMKGNK